MGEEFYEKLYKISDEYILTNGILPINSHRLNYTPS